MHLKILINEEVEDMPKNYDVAMGNGWQIQLVVDPNEDSADSPICYLTFHGGVMGKIRAKECLFTALLGDISEDVKMRARKTVAKHREEIEETWKYNRKLLTEV